MANKSGRQNRLTVEKLAAECLDVRDLHRVGALKGGWQNLTQASLRWPSIETMRTARFMIYIELHNQTVRHKPCHYAPMFVRFRQSGHRLHVSVVEARRVNGKVRQEHIASLGSVEVPPSVEMRLMFWCRLHERLAKLDNRIDQATQAKILGDIHKRIPMVTIDEQRAKQLENAEAHERFWTCIRDMNETTAQDHKAFSVKAERAAASLRVQADDAAATALASKQRAERLRRGEDVPGGLGKAPTYEDYERIFGKDLMRNARQMHEVCEVFGFDEVRKIILAEKERAERSAMRALHRRINPAADEAM